MEVTAEARFHIQHYISHTCLLPFITDISTCHIYMTTCKCATIHSFLPLYPLKIKSRCIFNGYDNIVSIGNSECTYFSLVWKTRQNESSDSLSSPLCAQSAELLKKLTAAASTQWFSLSTLLEKEPKTQWHPQCQHPQHFHCPWEPLSPKSAWQSAYYAHNC